MCQVERRRKGLTDSSRLIGAVEVLRFTCWHSGSQIHMRIIMSAATCHTVHQGKSRRVAAKVGCLSFQKLGAGRKKGDSTTFRYFECFLKEFDVKWVGLVLHSVFFCAKKHWCFWSSTANPLGFSDAFSFKEQKTMLPNRREKKTSFVKPSFWLLPWCICVRKTVHFHMFLGHGRSYLIQKKTMRYDELTFI